MKFLCRFGLHNWTRWTPTGQFMGAYEFWEKECKRCKKWKALRSFFLTKWQRRQKPPTNSG